MASFRKSKILHRVADRDDGAGAIGEGHEVGRGGVMAKDDADIAVIDRRGGHPHLDFAARRWRHVFIAAAQCIEADTIQAIGFHGVVIPVEDQSSVLLFMLAQLRADSS
jgi:hypothetical protein